VKHAALVVFALVLVALALPRGATPDGGVAEGQHLYGRYCLACHGAAGAGTKSPRTVGAGPLRAQTTQEALAPSLRGVGALAADFYLRTGYMPLARVGDQPRRRRLALDDVQIRALVAYVASLGKGPRVPTPHPSRGSLSQGQQLFAERCAGCHQILGAGGYVTGAVPPALGDATARQIAEAVRIGPYVMPRFSKAALNDHELDSLIRYVQYAKHPQDRGGWNLGHLGPIPEGLTTWLLGAAALVALCLLVGRRLRE
jgi:ubiquinol-cytochrome c reductase cytochrome c subunit